MATIRISKETSDLVSKMRSEVDDWEAGGPFTFWERVAEVIASAQRDETEGREKTETLYS